ncbi:ABC transporter permease [Miniphocaeibacter massiliensis]|uniref:ABC transporter permease n=1 Tax=Miniphocaeibacter massiliensis TaxID=2041841 RepID=UPI000C07C724|nr:ABC transporter permease [Miniphocaeibacter massiliensis]
MLKLIKLEYRKNRAWKYLINALILTFILGLFVFSIGFFEDASPGSKETVGFLIEMITSMAFLVFTGVMISSFIVSAYKNNTMGLMFTYPINRKKILISKVIAVWIISFICLLISKLIIYLSMYGFSNILEPKMPLGYNLSYISFYTYMIFKSFTTVATAFLALPIGILLNSSKAVIITSFILLVFLEGDIGDFSLRGNSANSIILSSIILTAISIFFIIFSIRNVDKKDLV